YRGPPEPEHGSDSENIQAAAPSGHRRWASPRRPSRRRREPAPPPPEPCFSPDSLNRCPVKERVRHSVGRIVDPALFDFVLLPPPTAGPIVLARRGGPGAGRAADRRVAGFVKRVIRDVVRADVVPHSRL